jgi:hypothetical protein
MCAKPVVTLEFCENSEDPSYGPFTTSVKQAWFSGGRSAVQKLLREAPKVRTRSGFVGPEPDWSIRYARIRLPPPGVGTADLFRKRYDLWYRSQGPTSPRNTVLGVEHVPFRLSLHNHFSLLDMDDNAVRNWTKAAHAAGVRFNGDYGYSFPGPSKVSFYRKQEFGLAKKKGLVPSGKRSAESAVRRKEKRSRVLLRKGWSAISIEEPVVVRPSMGARALRREWSTKYSGSKTWTSYRSTVVVEPVETCILYRSRSPVPKLVKDALTRIYSQPVRLNPEVLNFSDNVAKRQIKFVDRGVNPHLEELPEESFEGYLRRSLSAIEEAGFHQRWKWFSMNHMLTKLASSKTEVKPGG